MAGDVAEACAHKVEVVHAELRDRAIERIEFYQNDQLVRCSECGQHWLTQFWEFDTEETRLKEWGVTERRTIPLDANDVARIEDALATGVLLPHGCFHRPV